MKILIVDADAIHLSFAWRCAQAGHEVKWFPRTSGKNPVLAGNGFKGITKVDNWVSHAAWADLIVPTGNNLYLERLDFFRKKGMKVYGPSIASADLEIKRGLGMEVLQKHGIEVPPYKVFKTLKDAEKHVWKTEGRFVFKTLGDNEDKSLSYCSKHAADMIAKIRKWREDGLNPKGEVMLQEFIEGEEFAVSRWMGKNGWVGLPNENWEEKKFMSGNYGPTTGEMGTVMGYVKQSKLFDDTLAKLEHPLLELGHLGDVDINFIIPEDGKPRALEFTCRFGYPAMSIMMMAHKGDPAQWMLDAFEGKDTLECSEEVTVGVVAAIPPFPNKNMELEKVAGKPIYGVTPRVRKYFQPTDVQILTLPDMQGETVVERPIWATAGCLIGIMTGTGKTISQARERAFKTLDEIHIPEMEVRDDVGERVQESLKKLQKMGFATGFKWE